MSYPGYYGSQYPQGFSPYDDSDISPIDDDLFMPPESGYRHQRHYSNEYDHYGRDNLGYSYGSYNPGSILRHDMPYTANGVANAFPHGQDQSKSVTTGTSQRHDSTGPSSPDSRYRTSSSMHCHPPSSRGERLTTAPCRHASVQQRAAVNGGRPYCTHADCLDANGQPMRSFSRKADVSRHHRSQHEPQYIDCPYARCSRKGDNGFTRNDHLIEHQRQYHAKDIPKRGSGGGRRSTQGGRHASS